MGKCRENKIDELVRGFEECIDLLSDDDSTRRMAEQTDREWQLYSNGGHVTYFADEYILDVLADTTERGPTFTTPPFRPRHRHSEPLSWAFVKNPFLDTVGAWESLFGRLPRCVEKTEDEYKAIGIRDADIKKIPEISRKALYEFEIGREEDLEREGEGSLATWVSLAVDTPDAFLDAAKRYADSSVLSLSDKGIKTKTRMNLFEHLAMKMAINAVSTGTMAKMGRVLGNYMVHLNISNKKLVDRATRIIADLCRVDYERANYELFLSSLLLDSRAIERSTTVETVERLGLKL
jgi:N-acetylmuramic acid 6-phosphate etherase